MEIIRRPLGRDSPPYLIQAQLNQISHQNKLMCCSVLVAFMLFIIMMFLIYFFSPYNQWLPQDHLKYPA